MSETTISDEKYYFLLAHLWFIGSFFVEKPYQIGLMVIMGFAMLYLSYKSKNDSI